MYVLSASTGFAILLTFIQLISVIVYVVLVFRHQWRWAVGKVKWEFPEFAGIIVMLLMAAGHVLTLFFFLGWKP